jgi:hypothetical protein
MDRPATTLQKASEAHARPVHRKAMEHLPVAKTGDFVDFMSHYRKAFYFIEFMTLTLIRPNPVRRANLQ